MIVAGLDVDTKAAHFCLWDGRQALQWGDVERQADIEWFIPAGVEAVYIEDVPYVLSARNPKTTIQLSQAIGRWQARVETIGLKYGMVGVTKWKAFAISNGQASKDDVKGAIVFTTNLPDGLKQHIYDACGIAIAGHALERMAGVAPS